MYSQIPFFHDRLLSDNGLFLDIGFYKGDVSDYVLQNSQNIVHAYDLVKCGQAHSLKKKWGNRFHFHNYGISVASEKAVPFYGVGEGATIFKPRDDKAGVTDTISLSQLIIDHAAYSEKSITVKLDAEGLEFDLIPDLVETGAIKLVDLWFIDWHHNQFGIDPIETFKLFSEHATGIAYHWQAEYDGSACKEIKI